MAKKPAYRIQILKPNVVLIQWFTTPPHHAPVLQEWLAELWNIVNTATEPICFVSDLRNGCVTDIHALKELAAIAQHPKCALGVGFSQSISSEVYANLFARISKENNPITDSPEAALRVLEDYQPGISADIDWRSALVESETA